jgi:hypothetical protein
MQEVYRLERQMISCNRTGDRPNDIVVSSRGGHNAALAIGGVGERGANVCFRQLWMIGDDLGGSAESGMGLR